MDCEGNAQHWNGRIFYHKFSNFEIRVEIRVKPVQPTGPNASQDNPFHRCRACVSAQFAEVEVEPPWNERLELGWQCQTLLSINKHTPHRSLALA